MLKRFLVILLVVFASALLAFAQNSNSSTTTTRTRTVEPKPSPTPKSTGKSTGTGAASQRPKASSTPVAPSTGVLAAFDKIIEGIRRSNIDMYTSGYWNSANLVLFNYNGTVTKGWDQLRKNRESSFPETKEVKLDVRDKHVQMLGRDGAVVTCLWIQSQTFKGQPDTASGRMTLVLKRVGADWKAVHLHTSPDKPDVSRVPASEQSPPPNL
ncbi:MAG TPA: nuclear transport factor 2 family protein [Pyrinomonadaceae bacterium]|nr:nuclear transport factor 2 family protein [Pyrinomonadaceae bacterium]